MIDRQHRELLEMVDRVDKNPEPSAQWEVLRLLERVMAFAEMHFDAEEALMSRVHYPSEDRIEMTEQHREFRSYARLRVLEFQFRQITGMASFIAFLRDWLVQHEFGLDKKLASFIQSSGQTVTAHPASAPSKR